MRRKKLLILFLCLAIFCLLEIGIIVFWSCFSHYNSPVSLVEKGSLTRDVRIGILTGDLTRSAAKKKWQPFLKTVGENSKLQFRPYFTSSFEDIELGLENNFDLVYLNSALYLKLKENHKIEAFAYDYSETRENYAVLVSKKDTVTFINETRGKRLMFTNKSSLTGYLIPRQFLAKKLGMPLKQWFSNIEFAGTDRQAISSLLTGKVDVIAINYGTLKRSTQLLTEGKQNVDLHILWMFRSIPQDVFCMNPKRKEPLRNQIMEALVNNPDNFRADRQEELGHPMFFVPPDQTYKGDLKEFESFIDEPDKESGKKQP